TLIGRLVDGNGKPLSGVRGGLQYPSFPDPGMRPPEEAIKTDREGRFRVEGLIPGRKHELTVTRDKKDINLSADVLKQLSAAAGEVKDLGDIKLPMVFSSK